MGSELAEQDLWMSLSNAFLDAEIDYGNIARAVKDYSVADIKFALFERVGPVCIWNLLTPTPPVWFCFERDWLIAEIESYVQKKAKQGRLRKLLSLATTWSVRLACVVIWKKINFELAKLK